MTAWHRLVVAQVLLQGCMAGLRLAIPLGLLELQFSAAEVGVTMALFYAAGLFMSMHFAALMDRWGMRAAWQVGVGLAVAGSLACALWPNWWGMSCGALLSGASASLAQMVSQKSVAQSFAQPARRSAAFGWMMLAVSAGNLVGPVSVGLLLDRAGHGSNDPRSLAAVCLFTGSLALASGFFALALNRARRASHTPAAARGNLAALVRDAPVSRVLLCSALVAVCWDGFVLFAPVLGHARGLSASAIGTILGAFAIAAAAVRPLLGRVPASVPATRVVAGGLVLTAVVCLVYPFVTSLPGLVACAAILGMALGLAQPLLLTALSYLTPAHLQSQALGLRLTITSGSHVAIPMVFGGISTLVGVAPVFALSALVAACSAWLAWRTPGRR